VALMLPTPTPLARVVRLTVRGVAAGGGAKPFAPGPPPLDVTNVRLLIKPSLPPVPGAEAEAGGRGGDGGGGGGGGGSGGSVNMDPTRDCIAAPSSRPAVARALEEPPPGVRTRVPPAFEEVHANGTVLHVGLPALPRGVAGFRVVPPDPLPRAAPW